MTPTSVALTTPAAQTCLARQVSVPDLHRRRQQHLDHRAGRELCRAEAYAGLAEVDDLAGEPVLLAACAGT